MYICIYTYTDRYARYGVSLQIATIDVSDFITGGGQILAAVVKY